MGYKPINELLGKTCVKVEYQPTGGKSFRDRECDAVVFDLDDGSRYALTHLRD